MAGESRVDGGCRIRDLGIRDAQQDDIGMRLLAAAKRALDLDAGAAERLGERAADATRADYCQPANGLIGKAGHSCGPLPQRPGSGLGSKVTLRPWFSGLQMNGARS